MEIRLDTYVSPLKALNWQNVQVDPGTGIAGRLSYLKKAMIDGGDRKPTFTINAAIKIPMSD